MQLVKEITSVFTNLSALYKPDVVTPSRQFRSGTESLLCCLGPPYVSLAVLPNARVSPADPPTPEICCPRPRLSACWGHTQCCSHPPVPCTQCTQEQAGVHRCPCWGSLASLALASELQEFFMTFYFTVDLVICYVYIDTLVLVRAAVCS